jgi:hypothetical protein
VEQHSLLQGHEPDIVVSTSSEKIVIEVKTTRHVSGARHMIERGLLAAARYLELDGVTGAVLVVFSPEEADYEVFRATGPPERGMRIVSG